MTKEDESMKEKFYLQSIPGLVDSILEASAESLELGASHEEVWGNNKNKKEDKIMTKKENRLNAHEILDKVSNESMDYYEMYNLMLDNKFLEMGVLPPRNALKAIKIERDECNRLYNRMEIKAQKELKYMEKKSNSTKLEIAINSLKNNPYSLEGICYNNIISDKNAKALAEVLRDKITLSILSLCDNNISEEGTIILFGSLANCNISTFCFDNNSVSDEAMVILSNSLRINRRLKSLDLKGNNISDEAMVILSDSLRINRRLERLNLSCNNISDEGISELAKTLKYNDTLQILDLSYNNISDEGVSILKKALETNSTLTIIVLEGNDILNSNECIKNTNKC